MGYLGLRQIKEAAHCHSGQGVGGVEASRHVHLDLQLVTAHHLEYQSHKVAGRHVSDAGRLKIGRALQGEGVNLGRRSLYNLIEMLVVLVYNRRFAVL